MSHMLFERIAGVNFVSSKSISKFVVSLKFKITDWFYSLSGDKVYKYKFFGFYLIYKYSS